MSKVTDGCATIAMSTGAGTRWRKPAMLMPGRRCEGTGTAMSTPDHTGGIPWDDTTPV